MYITTSGQTKYKVVQLKENTRIPGAKKKKSKVLLTLGNYANMFVEDPEFMKKLRAETKRKTQARKVSQKPLSLQVASDTIVSASEVVPRIIWVMQS